jgi:hypothetical protein
MLHSTYYNSPDIYLSWIHDKKFKRDFFGEEYFDFYFFFKIQFWLVLNPCLEQLGAVERAERHCGRMVPGRINLENIILKQS